MSDARYPFAYNDKGVPIPPENGLQGERYWCPICREARVCSVHPDGRYPFFRGVAGTVHTHPDCKQEAGRTGILYRIIDVAAILNCAKTRTSEPPIDPPEVKPPVRPRGEKRRATICPNLQSIHKHKVHVMEDFTLHDGSQLSDHLVSGVNSHLILDRNTSLRRRVVEMYPEYCSYQQVIIRGAVKGHKGVGGRETAARMIIEIKFECVEDFMEARDICFVKVFDPQKGYKRYLPRFKKVLVAGDFFARKKGECRTISGCTSQCNTRHTHCIGLQIVHVVNPRKQICGAVEDQIVYPKSNT